MLICGLSVTSTKGNSFRIWGGTTMKLRHKLAMAASAAVLSLAMAAPAMADTHVVQSGDTLWDLYGTRYPAVAAANGIANPDLIFPGQRVRTGSHVVRHQHKGTGNYVVKSGDTLWKLVGTRWPSVAQANGLSNPDLIYPGQHLRLGGGVGSVTAVVVASRPPPPPPAPVVSTPSSCAGLSYAEQQLLMHESGCRTTADNPTSTAFGIWQGLLETRIHYGAVVGVSPYTTDFAEQYKMFRAYLCARYNCSAEQAWAFWQAHYPHWY